jgi:hypothetical protein
MHRRDSREGLHQQQLSTVILRRNIEGMQEKDLITRHPEERFIGIQAKEPFFPVILSVTSKRVFSTSFLRALKNT